MLRITQNSDAASAKGYYSGRAEAGYYAGAATGNDGRLGRAAAEALGFVGEVDPPRFRAALRQPPSRNR